MKNETARREIESLDYYLQNHTDDYSEESHTAMMMAIKALEQEPCTDAVSREDAIESIANIDETDGTVAIFTGKQVIALLNDLPSVTQKSGKWIMSDDGLYRPICDKCGAHPWKGYIPTVEEATEVFKYCPNCGAKMQESEDKE